MSDSNDSASAKERARLRAKKSKRRSVPRYPSLMLHWAGRLLRPPARAKVAPLPSVGAKQVGISFAGHATALIRYRQLGILCDPMLGDWCGSIHREVRPGLSPAELGDVELILLSHQRPDHLHPKTLSQLPRGATVIVPPRTARFVSDFGFARVIELGPDQSVEHRRVDITAVRVRHGDKKAPASAYVIRGDGPSVFFCGASGYTKTFDLVGRRFSPDIALLPIGGYSPKSFRRQNMTPLDALAAFEDLRSKIMIPVRYGAFALSYERLFDPPAWLREAARDEGLEDYIVPLEAGQSRVFVRPKRSKRQPSKDAQARQAPASKASDVSRDEPAPVPEAESSPAPATESAA